MKKIMKYHKIGLLTGMLLLPTVATELSAQQSRSSYFMKNSTVSMKQNPAFRPEQGYVSIPGLGMINPSASTNGLTLDQIVYPKGDENVLFLDPSVDTNNFLDGLNKNSKVDVTLGTQLFGAGWYQGCAFWSVDVTVKAMTNFSVPKTLFEFLKRGTGPEGATYDMSNILMQGDSYVEAGVGYSRPINEKLTVGGKFKFLLGAGSVKAQIDRMHAVMSAGRWQITTEGTMNASVKGLETESKKDSEGKEYIDNYKVNNFGVAGFGAGIDLGASYRLTDKITLSGALLDLGFLSWGSGVYGVSNGDFKFDGFALAIGGNNDMKAQFDVLTNNLESLMRFREQGKKSHTMMLYPTLNIGGEYSLLPNKLSFGLLSSTRFSKYRTYSELTASANYRPIDWFEGTLSYSFIHSGFKTFGLAMNFSPCWINFFIGSDYMFGKVTSEFIPINSRVADAYIGISIPLNGSKRRCCK